MNKDQFWGLFFVMLYCDLKEFFPFVRCSAWHFAEVVWFLPLFYEDRFIILWLGLSPLYLNLINVFLLICFCSAYVIPLFGRCSRVLDPALDSSSPLTKISYSEYFHYMYRYLDHCLSWILSQAKIYCSWILLFSHISYGWLFLIFCFFFYLFSFWRW